MKIGAPIDGDSPLGKMISAAIMESSGDSEIKRNLNYAASDVAVESLKEALANYQAGAKRFKVGDFITPRRNAPIKGSGFPHIVLEIFPTAHRNSANENAGEFTFYGRYDMRVAVVVKEGEVVPYTVESWMYQPWTPETERTK